MKEALRRRARELGFEDCRVTTAAPPESGARFTEWLNNQHHGEMAYLARNTAKRVDPQKVLPGARSIITLAASYATPSHQLPRPPNSAPELPPPSSEARRLALRNPPAGVVARYARFQDYHDVLGERLKQLGAYLVELGGPTARWLWYVDTGPLLERDLAQRSGLGFIGKHTNLISRRLGNWIFLAEIITTLELEPDDPELNRCGSCTRCIQACPTSAILGPFQLDSRRCISYLTIELKGPIPLELRRAIGDRIYGCDDCLAACPWNRFAHEGRMMRSRSRADLDAPALLDLLSLDDARFKRQFAGTPILRTKRRGLLRNVCVALGNVGDSRALPALEQAATDPEPLISEHARWAIAEVRQRANLGH